MKTFRTHSQKGYIALMAAIVISLMLLVMIGEESLSGSFLRSAVLGVEYKEQSESLARGCADSAAAALVSDPAYEGHMTVSLTLDNGETYVCTVGAIKRDRPISGEATIQTQADVQGSFTSLQAVLDQDSGTILSVKENPGA